MKRLSFRQALDNAQKHNSLQGQVQLWVKCDLIHKNMYVCTRTNAEKQALLPSNILFLHKISN